MTIFIDLKIYASVKKRNGETGFLHFKFSNGKFLGGYTIYHSLLIMFGKLPDLFNNFFK